MRAVPEWVATHDDQAIPPRVKNLTGRRFGRLTAVSFGGYAKNGGRVAAWNCVCDCGTTRLASGVELSRGRILSCGCASTNSPIDLTGRVFHAWTVLGKAENSGGRTKWRCRCACGIEKSVFTNHLVEGRSKSCGCIRPTKARVIQRHPLYSTWSNMLQRCSNPNNKSYKNYGGRGITVCVRWRTDFWSFVADMGDRPTRGHSLERMDNNLGYTPENCVWATRVEQGRNRRNNHLVTYDGKTMPLSQAVELAGANYGTVKWRLKHGVSDSEAIR